MGSYRIGTDRSYLQYVVNTNEYITGNWPNLAYHVDYNFQWYGVENGASIEYNNSYYEFYTNSQKVATHITLKAGQLSGVICSGAFNLGWVTNARSQMHVIETSVSSWASGSSNIGLRTLTIPVGTLSATLTNVTHNSASFNISYTSPHNYWYVCIWNTTGTLYKDKCGNGINTITNLSPGQNYTFNVELWGQDGSMAIRRQITLRTTGFSYTDSKSTVIGENLPIIVKTYDDSFTNTLRLMINGTEYYSIKDFKSTNLTRTINIPFTEKQIQGIYTLIPNNTSIVGTVVIDTYENGKLLGTTETNITFQVDKESNAPVIENSSYQDISNAMNKTNNSEWIIQEVSVVNVTTEAIARNGATIVKYLLEIEDKVYESNTSIITTNATIKTNVGMYITVIDSRGLQTTMHKPFVRFIEYEKPSITKIEAKRVNDVEEETNLQLQGTFNRLVIDEIDKNIELKLRFRYKQTSGTTWGSYIDKTLRVDGNAFSFNDIIASFDTGSTFDIQVEISDYFNRTVAQVMLLKGEFELFIGDGRVDINGSLFLNEEDISNRLKSIDTKLTELSNPVALYDYSTKEVLLPFTYEGKPLYQKSFSFKIGAGANIAIGTIPVTGKVRFFDPSGSWVREVNGNTWCIFAGEPTGVQYQLRAYIEPSGTIIMLAGNTRTYEAGFITVRYTKE